MRKTFVVAAALAALVAPAGAADLLKAAPYAPPSGFSWTGIYVGVHAGYEFGAFDPNFNSNSAALANAVASLTDPGVLGPNASGGAGGLNAGFKYQTGNIVFGLEGRATISGLQGSVTDPVTASVMTHSIPWHGNVDASVGFLFTPTTLFSAHGGVAIGEIKDAANSAILAATLGTVPAISSDNVHVGWDAGLTVEHAFAGTPLSIGVDWTYTNLGKHGVTFAGPGAAPVTFNIEDKAAFNSIMGFVHWKLLY